MEETPVKKKKRWVGILATVVIFFVLGILFKDAVAKRILIHAIRNTTGVSLKIEELHLALLKGVFKAKGLELMNPRGFPEKMLAHIPELYVNMDLKAFLQGKIHLEEIVLNLDQLIILRNSEGELNLSSLKPVQEPPSPLSSPPKGGRGLGEGESQKKEQSFQLDYLRLSVGRVYFRDYRVGNPPPSREFPIGIQEKEYHDIQDAGDLVRQIVAQALTKSSFAELGDLGKIQQRLEKNLGQAQDSMKAKTQKVLQEASETLSALQFLGSQPPSEAEESTGN